MTINWKRTRSTSKRTSETINNLIILIDMLFNRPNRLFSTILSNYWPQRYKTWTKANQFRCQRYHASTKTRGNTAALL
jgi:hypothetical protein